MGGPHPLLRVIDLIRIGGHLPDANIHGFRSVDDSDTQRVKESWHKPRTQCAKKLRPLCTRVVRPPITNNKPVTHMPPAHQHVNLAEQRCSPLHLNSVRVYGLMAPDVLLVNQARRCIAE
eukprot:scaffold837_cov416-Prasinococcus_capsulatus_cf.AAC.7